MDQHELGKMLIYQTEKGDTKIDVYFENGTVWMAQKSLAALYQTSPQNITVHIKNIYADGELSPEATCKDYLQVQAEGERQVERKIRHYNFQMILAVGYRVRNHVGVHFRNWATAVLTEYTKKGFVLNDDRLKNPKPFGVDYFDELLERIRDIRASEKRFYEKVKEIYATSVDYDSGNPSAARFFATVQNKMHYSVHGHTAAEIIVSRADAARPNMGLTSFSGAKVRKADVTVAKNYLTQEEITNLNRIVTMYLDYAEDQARRHIPMHMADWEQRLDGFLRFTGREVLTHLGTVSAQEAQKIAEKEYESFETARHLPSADVQELQEQTQALSREKKV